MAAHRPGRYLPYRPLPARAFVPGKTPRPPDPEGRPLDRPAEEWRFDEDYLFGVDLYNAGFCWEAHEAWEGIWRVATDRDRRDLLQGLIQCAAAALKAAMDEPNGVSRLAERGTRLLEATGARVPGLFMGLDVAGFARAFRAWAASGPAGAGERPRIVLCTRSRDLLGCLTDRRVQPAETEFLPREHYLLGRSTGSGGFDGQVLILDRAPDPEEVEARLSDCRREIEDRPIRRLNLVWEERRPGRWSGAGQIVGIDRYEHLVVLRCDRAIEETALPGGTDVRPIDGDRDWEKLAKLSILIYGEHFGPSLAEFARWRYREFRRAVGRGAGLFWGAFRNDRLIGSLGLFESDTLLRFQEVQTHPRHRRRGVCSALVTRALARARALHPRSSAIIVAEPDSPAESIYRRLGFARAGAQHWLSRPRRTAVALLEAYASAHNTGVRSGDFSALVGLFCPDASMRFSGIDAGPFTGRQAIAEAFAEDGPADELSLLEPLGDSDAVVTRAYGWRHQPGSREGTITLAARGGRIAAIDVAVERPPA